MDTLKPRFDLLLFDESGFAISDTSARLFMRSMATRLLSMPFDEVLAKDWAEVYLRPGPMAHTLFAEGTAPEDPVFTEMAFRFGDTAVTLPFGPFRDPVRFFLEIRGCLFDTIPGRFRNDFAEHFMATPRLVVRPHSGLLHRRTVPEGEARTAPEKKSAPSGAVGTRVEEW